MRNASARVSADVLEWERDVIIQKRCKELGIDPSSITPNQQLVISTLGDAGFANLKSRKSEFFPESEPPVVITAEGTSIHPGVPPVSENLLRDSLTDLERNQLVQFAGLMNSNGILALLRLGLSVHFPHTDAKERLTELTNDIKQVTCTGWNKGWDLFEADKAFGAAESIALIVDLMQEVLTGLPMNFLPSHDTLLFMLDQFYKSLGVGE